MMFVTLCYQLKTDEMVHQPSDQRDIINVVFLSSITNIVVPDKRLLNLNLSVKVLLPEAVSGRTVGSVTSSAVLKPR